MKKQNVIGILVSGLIMLLFVCGCIPPEDAALQSLGSYESKEFYSHGEFQDYTDYAKYRYETVDFSLNSYFRQMTDESMEKLKEHIADFEEWIATFESNDACGELVVHYDFDSTIISADDYLYIYDDPDYPEFGNYDVYFFDMGTMTLYYFHNNI